jgi:hypothetical protein
LPASFTDCWVNQTPGATMTTKTTATEIPATREGRLTCRAIRSCSGWTTTASARARAHMGRNGSASR